MNRRSKASLTSGLFMLLFLALGVHSFPSTQQRQQKSEQDQNTMRLIPSLEGSDLFHNYCASCHGADGKGGGPAAPALKAHLPDLTTVAKRNHGVFPAERIERIIAGDESAVAHGSREMPIWGPIFHQIEHDQDYGNIRLHNLTKYIESIQQK